MAEPGPENVPAPGTHDTPDSPTTSPEAPGLDSRLPLIGNPPRLKQSSAVKEMLFAGAELARPESAPAMSMTLATFLESRLGSKFHRRSEWAGHSGKYAPQPVRGRNWRSIGHVSHLTVHHASGVPDRHPARMIRLIYNGHTNRYGRLDAADVGYHFFVDREGDVWEGRTAAKQGTHVASKPTGRNNPGNLGICGLGTFAYSTPARAMRDSISGLSVLISRYYGRPLGVRGHKDWFGINGFRPKGSVDCPGRLEATVYRSRDMISDSFERNAISLDVATEAQPIPSSTLAEAAHGDRITRTPTSTLKPTQSEALKMVVHGSADAALH